MTRGTYQGSGTDQRCRPRLSATHPELLGELVDRASGDHVTHSSHKALVWKCMRDPRHGTYTMSANQRVRMGQGCPACVNRKVVTGVNDIASTNPHMARYLVDHSLSTVLHQGHTKPVEWRCLERMDHPTWRVSPKDFYLKSSNPCPACRQRRFVPGVNDLWTVAPDLAMSLVDSSIGHLVTAKSSQVAEWKCLTDPRHLTWLATIANRTAGTGCGVCSNKRVQPGINDLLTLLPDLAMELVDRSEATGVTCRSDRKLLWQCRFRAEHRWRASAANRVRGTGCPQCARSGFKADSPAFLYVVKADDLEGRGKAAKFGVANALDIRLRRHRRKGFSTTPVLVLPGIGSQVLAVEQAVKRGLKSSMTPSCADHGMAFDGSTEAYLAEDLPLRSLLRRIRSAAGRAGLL